MKINKTGSVLPTVILSTFVVTLIVLSLLNLINTERKLNLKKELMLQATEAAESAADYAYSFMVNEINSQTLAEASSVPQTGYKNFAFGDDAQSFLTGKVTMGTDSPVATSHVSFSAPDVRVLPATPATARIYIDGTDDGNRDDPNKDEWVRERQVPVISAVTASQGGQQYTAYVQKNVSSREVALFQYAIFFQGQLHLHRGYGHLGDVHANGNLFLNAHDEDDAIYTGSVTSGHHIYRGSTFDKGGTGSDAFGYVASIKEEEGGWVDTAPARNFNPVITGISETHHSIKIYVNTTTKDNFENLDDLDCTHKNWVGDAQKFNGNLKDKSMNSPVLLPIGTAGYAEDVVGTPDKNEFNNAPYTLLEPNLPTDNPNHQASLANNLEARASLVLIVEYNCKDPLVLHKLDGTDGAPLNSSDAFDFDPKVNPSADLTQYADVWRSFMVKAYKVAPVWDRSLGTDIHEHLIPITLPTNAYHIIGKASSDATQIMPGANNDLVFEDFDAVLTTPSLSHTILSTMKDPIAALSNADKNVISNTGNLSVTIKSGLFDSRLGRGVSPITIDIDALKKVMEAPLASIPPKIGGVDNPDYLFRMQFDPTAKLTTGTTTKAQWNGLIYIEFPTSLALANTTPNDTAADGVLNTMNGKKTRRFAYSTKPELLHPDRWDVTDNFNRKDREDHIVPIAPELRRYPPAAIADNNATILDAQYVIPAVQVINGGVLPHPNSLDLTEGFTIATNVPIYLVGNYNCDGDYKTGTNFASTTPTSYATADSAQEIPAAFFCDMFTVLSNGWAERGTHPFSNRENSFYGAHNASSNGDGSTVGNVKDPPGRPCQARSSVTNPVYAGGPYDKFTYPATQRYVEISACVATGEYPIFEFFPHALEDYQMLYGLRTSNSGMPNPIIFKGSLVALFHSEIQHIKQAYGRDVTMDIQHYYRQHGMSAICTVRFHQFLYDGNYPPGTPMAYVTQPKNFRILRWGDSDDAKQLTTAGFTP